ncbi:hypothetical protein D9611_015024 [Ephemerocybe angulata]|uniref:Retrotransposon gag domain-containing protein n=1 Tax=Ephemerocybe angulata TaxID=980116 RepID=A0A8H5CBA8_9AGAR|nr:hypothetical protein D9611_015024 [Tulosesus angulatus]
MIRDLGYPRGSLEDASRYTRGLCAEQAQGNSLKIRLKHTFPLSNEGFGCQPDMLKAFLTPVAFIAYAAFLFKSGVALGLALVQYVRDGRPRMRPPTEEDKRSILPPSRVREGLPFQEATIATIAAINMQNEALNQAAEGAFITRFEVAEYGDENEPRCNFTEPEPFNGELEQVMPFLAHVHLYLNAIGEVDDRRRIIYALGLIGRSTNRSATNWADTMRQRLWFEEIQRLGAETQPNLDTVVPIFGDWRDFMKKFKAHFLPMGVEEFSRNTLDALTMRNKTCADYTLQFDRYASEAGYDDITLLKMYREGLARGLRRKVVESYPRPSDLTEWKEQVLHFDREYRRERYRKRSRIR